MIHLREVRFKPSRRRTDRFPFNVLALTCTERIRFAQPVTFFVGENGSGKSTLLEGIAAAVRLPTAGSSGVAQDETLAHAREVGDSLAQVWNRRTHKGFFLRAEDFFGFAKRVARLRHEAEESIAAIGHDYAGRSEMAKGLAAMPHARDLHEIERLYGEGLDAGSHGEAFLKLFQARMILGGLYLLDEPEAPLSPLRQLALLSLLKQFVAEECQFIIATHSPILLALPGAAILSFDANGVTPSEYGDLEHVALTRDFLNDPERYLKQL